jgi:inosine/xanthosine triphosphate pyrophosphatase family protein
MFIPDGHTKTLGEMGPDERIAAHAFTRAYAALRRDHGF